MDGTTEPLIAVIGHPIAGNPTQFAVERALRSLEMDWRVLSFDVRPDDIAAALEGFAVTGIAGVMIDPSVMDEASRWYDQKRHDDPELDEADQSSADDQTSDNQVRIDCLYRDQQQRLIGSYERRAWVDQRIAQHSPENRLWLGDTLDGVPLTRNGFGEDPAPSPPDPETVLAASLIVIAPGADRMGLEAEEWPQDDGSTLLIDLTSGHPEQATIRELGYQVMTKLERRIGTLQGCLKRWTGEDASPEVIRDAIEEYLGV